MAENPTDNKANTGSTSVAAPAYPDRIMRIGDVCALLGVRETSLRRWIKVGHFPPPMKIGPKDSQASMSGWLASEVADWVGRCKTRRDITADNTIA